MWQQKEPYNIHEHRLRFKYFSVCHFIPRQQLIGAWFVIKLYCLHFASMISIDAAQTYSPFRIQAYDLHSHMYSICCFCCCYSTGTINVRWISDVSKMCVPHVYFVGLLFNQRKIKCCWVLIMPVFLHFMIYFVCARFGSFIRMLFRPQLSFG